MARKLLIAVIVIHLKASSVLRNVRSLENLADTLAGFNGTCLRFDTDLVTLHLHATSRNPAKKNLLLVVIVVYINKK